MPKWDVATDRKLLLTIIEVLNTSGLPYEEIAAKMGEGFTKEAVRQHFAKLKKGDGKGEATESNPPNPGLTHKSRLIDTTFKVRKSDATISTPGHVAYFPQRPWHDAILRRSELGQSFATSTGRKKGSKSRQTEDPPTAGFKRKNSETVTTDNKDDSEVEVKKAKMEDQRGTVIKAEEISEDGSIDLAHDSLYN